jgi:hypothetical protein
VTDQDAAIPKYERLAVDGDGDTWGRQDGQWRCLTAGGRADDDEELAGQYPPVIFYAPAALADAARHFTATWSELIEALPDSYGCEMNCPEANAAEELWRAAGDEGTAGAIAAAHAEHDDEGDEHYQGTATAAGEGKQA